MAQMFRALNYKGYHGSGYNDYLNKFYSYKYQFNMTMEEIRVISILQKEDKESFDERTMFFNFDVVYEMYEDYLRKLESYIDKLPEKKCKGVPYKTIKGKHIFVTDMNKKIFIHVSNFLTRIKYLKAMGDYESLYHAIRRFHSSVFIELPSNTMKSSKWKDAYKGAGAYYTLKNMIIYHDCFIRSNNGICFKYGALDYLNKKAIEYKGEGWRLFGFMKEVIKDNHFDFDVRMREIYAEK